MDAQKPTSAALQEQLAAPLAALSESEPTDDDSSDSTPSQIAEAFARLLHAMRQTEVSYVNENQAGPDGASELGEYAMELFRQALGRAEQLDLVEEHATLQTAVIVMARWVACQGGQLLSLETVVDALARLANQKQDPGDLLALYQVMGEIMDATAVVIRKDLETTNPGRPWRILNLNRAIVATRTHQPDIMEEAFGLLSEQFPQDAPDFFAQGMEQMDLLNYPPHVREVMDRYFRKWSIDRSLH